MTVLKSASERCVALDGIYVKGFGAVAQTSDLYASASAVAYKFLHEWVPPCIACQNGKLRCGYSPDLLAILQGNPGRTTPDFASVHTLAVLSILRFPFYEAPFLE